jgi:glycosyltransferase involved in cell wall biosynthesis
VEINLFTYGDSSNIKTFSSFPYYFSNGLIKNGVQVNRIDISIDTWILEISLQFSRIEKILFRPLSRKPTHSDLYSSRLRMLSVMHKVRKAIQYHPCADFNFFMNYDYPIYCLSKIPTVYYCDQTLEQSYKANNKTALTKDEIFYLEAQKNALTHAKIIFSTWPTTIDFLQNEWKLSNVYPKNVVGISIDPPVDSSDELINLKCSNREILFIGRDIYGRGLDILIKAFKLFNQRSQNNYRLNIVGFSRKDLITLDLDESIHCYKYLSKDSPEDYRVYVDLLRRARLFVFPARSDLLAIAMLEALLYHTPVIASSVYGIEKYIQDGFNGLVINGTSPEAYSQAIEKMTLDSKLWRSLAKNAGKSVRKYTWEAAALEILNAIS